MSLESLKNLKKTKQNDRTEEARKCFTDQRVPQWEIGYIQRERQNITERRDSIVRGLDTQQDTLSLREVLPVFPVYVNEKFRVWPEIKREPRSCHKWIHRLCQGIDNIWIYPFYVSFK